jgi:hypothetical protein
VALLRQLADAAKDDGLAAARADPRFPGSGGAFDVTLTAQEMRRVPGGADIEVRGELVVRVRSVDARGRTLPGSERTETTPFVRTAVPRGDGWVFAEQPLFAR